LNSKQRIPRLYNAQTLYAAPLPRENRPSQLKKGPGHAPLPDLDPIPDTLELPALLKVGDNMSTDGIMPSGSASMSVWNSVSAMSEMSFRDVDSTYVGRARDTGDHAIVGGANYGQGSSREHAALGPRQLGLRAVIASSIARIHGENLVNYGILPLTLENTGDADRLKAGDVLKSAASGASSVATALACPRQLVQRQSGCDSSSRNGNARCFSLAARSRGCGRNCWPLSCLVAECCSRSSIPT
jgi:aconitase A